MNARPLPDDPARTRILEDLDATLFVEAAAGTGKTTALVGRIVALITRGQSRLDRLVAVTFTEKAAGEMKLRLRSEIEKARGTHAADPVIGARLDRALGELELARIGTIHAFCADVLHERPIEAGVDPRFDVGGDDVTEGLLRRAFDGWFQQVLDAPGEGVRRVLRRPAFMGEGPSDWLYNAVRGLVEHRDFEAAWTREPFQRDHRLDRILDQLAELATLADLAANPDRDYLAQNLRNVARFLRENRHRERGGARDYDGIEGALRAFRKTRRNGWHWRGYGDTYGPGLDRGDVLSRRDAVAVEVDRFIRDSDADLAALLREELRPVVAAYQDLKRDAGKLDFLDLLARTRDLLRDNASVRRDLQERFTHVFVDEFQDTDPLQADILLLLVADDPDQDDATRVTPLPGKLFVVGDPKQSIYRFRRADVSMYESIKTRLAARGVDVIHLTTSFRSVPAIQEAVNAAFAPVMTLTDDGSQAAYVALDPWREDPVDQPSVVTLPVPRPYGDYGTLTKWAIDRSYPDAVAGFIQWLLHESGWKVTERTGSGEADVRVPVQARHVCILFRRFRAFQDDVTRPYVAGLEARRIPHVLVGGRSYHDRDEVLGIRNVLQAIEWPDDELHVFAALKGPFLCLHDDALLAFRERYRSLHPLRPMNVEDLDHPYRDVAQALAILRELHYKRNRRPLAETLSRFLEAVRAHAGVALGRTGEQALANTLRAVDLARRFERGGAPSFRAFVERLNEEAERGGAEDAPIVEEGTDGVRVMTVHRAKGLEFPVVILADPGCRAVREVPTKHVDVERNLWAEQICGCTPRDLREAEALEQERDLAEAHRLTYVAATRARDLLVVPGVGDESLNRPSADDELWLDPLRPVTYPSDVHRGKPQPAPGAPAFGTDSVFERPPNAKRVSGGPVAPGLHHPAAGAHGVVWWDPAALELDASARPAQDHLHVLATDKGNAAAEAGETAHAAWISSRSLTLTAGSRPSRKVTPVTTLSEEPSGEPVPEIAVEATDAARGTRPAGLRFGALVHAALESVDLEATEDAVRRVVTVSARQVGASDEERDAAVVSVVAALAHPLLRRASAAEAVRREVPVLVALGDDGLAEGVVDLAFREVDAEGIGTWTVVDFKTDRELTERHDAYARQVDLYVRAVATATGERASGILLSV